MTEHKTLYRYGRLAWFWRFLITLFVIGGIGSLFFALRLGEAWLSLVAAVLLAPALFFGFVVAVQVERTGQATIRVVTLLFWRRRIRPGQLGRPRLRNNYHDGQGVMHAPRLWMEVRHQLPVYLDLLGEIPDRVAFSLMFRVPVSALPAEMRKSR